MDSIRILAASGGAFGGWYDEYRRLRHRIFVVEQGWQGLSPAGSDATVPDPADARAWFWLARPPAGALIGAVRVRPVRDIFPHEALFRHHLVRNELAAMRPWMGTLNSLAVDREWRGRHLRDQTGRISTAAAALLRASLTGSAVTGLRVLVATAQTAVSARALMRAGFRIIDRPVLTPLHPVFPMCNVGIVLRPHEECGRALASYFDDRQWQLLRGTTIDGLFAQARAA